MDTFALLALDLDGTFLTSEKKVSERSKAALSQVLQTGAKVAICTGRAVGFIKPITDVLGVDVFLVANEGTHVGYSHNGSRARVVRESTLSTKTVDAMVALVRETDRVAFWYDGTSVHVVVENEAQQLRLDSFLKLNRRSIASYSVWKTQQEFESKVVSRARLQKIMVLLEGEADATDFHAETVEALKLNRSAENVNIVVASAGLNVLPAGIDKGVGLGHLCEHLQIPLKRVIAFGDEANDVRFLRMAGVGVAMQNAVAAVKEAASYTIEFSNDQDGVAREIERLLADSRFGPIEKP